MEEQIKSDTIETRFGIFYVGQPVTYSVYPIIRNGEGMATRYGVLTVGQTYADVILAEDGTHKYQDMPDGEIFFMEMSRNPNNHAYRKVSDAEALNTKIQTVHEVLSNMDVYTKL